MSRQRAAKTQKRMNKIENTIRFDRPAVPKRAHQHIDLVPRSLNQERLVLALQDQSTHIVVTVGPAGTGKTYLAMLAAIKALRTGQCDRIVLTRPAVGVEDEKHGFLPGNLVAKMEPWTRPLLDVLAEHYRPQDIVGMIEDQVVEIAPLAFMRGRSLKNTIIIADEMQNATPNQMKMLMTRIGENSRIVITGDIEQTDRKKDSNGLLDLITRVKQYPTQGLSLVEFGVKDIQRHPMIERVLRLYQTD